MGPTPWSEVLDRVLQALHTAAAKAAERAQGLETPAAPAEREGGWQADLREGPRRLKPFQALVGQAGQTVAQTDALLEAEEETVRQWLAKAAAAARRLADGAGGAV